MNNKKDFSPKKWNLVFAFLAIFWPKKKENRTDLNHVP
jgi:hypothetical protein